jgi:hypothetical protein
MAGFAIPGFWGAHYLLRVARAGGKREAKEIQVSIEPNRPMRIGPICGHGTALMSVQLMPESGSDDDCVIAVGLEVEGAAPRRSEVTFSDGFVEDVATFRIKRSGAWNAVVVLSLQEGQVRPFRGTATVELQTRAAVTSWGRSGNIDS